MNSEVIIIGGGLAGVEAAFQIAEHDIKVKLYEMRPGIPSPAHTTDFLGEMVCSNSLGSESITTSNGLLKEELKLLNSFYLNIAEKFKVPAGNSFSVDRIELARNITEKIKNHPNIQLIEEEVKDLKTLNSPVLIASGPLTSPELAKHLTLQTLRKNLFFFDATSPIIRTDSINLEKCFFASRYDKGEADFLNIPLNKSQYYELVEDLVTSQKVPIKDFEKNMFFEACLPVEEIARRGKESLAFGPLKPVGLINPQSQKLSHAVIQLRQDDQKKNFMQMVGFQTRLTYSEQKRIFKKLPGLEKAKFERYGRMHKNTYINAPLIINKNLQSKQNSNVFFAGQISGVEGYVESIATGLYSGIVLPRILKGMPLKDLPLDTALGSLISYITTTDWKNFKPTKFTFGLLPGIKEKRITKKQRKEKKSERAITRIMEWKKSLNS